MTMDWDGVENGESGLKWTGGGGFKPLPFLSCKSLVRMGCDIYISY